jgi:hypothetical protein
MQNANNEIEIIKDAVQIVFLQTTTIVQDFCQFLKLLKHRVPRHCLTIMNRV